MRTLFEITTFLAMAFLAHLAIWSPSQDDGALQGAGAEGQNLLSIKASNASVAQMVKTWDTPPDTPATLVSMPAPAAPQTPDTPPMPRQTITPSPATPTMPKMSNVPDAPALPTYQKPFVRKAPEPPKKIAVSPARKPAPKPRSAPAKKPAAAKASRQAVARKAQGTGGGVAKGNNRNSKTATLSKSRRNSLLAKWGSQIRARIARRAPRGAGRGTAVVQITVSGSGALLGVRLSKSSGNPKVDKLAVAAVKRSGRFPAAPKQLGIRKHTFRLPVRSR